MLRMRKIQPPEWAPIHARGAVTIEEDGGREAFEAFAPFADSIWQKVHARIEEFVNDPEQTFQDDQMFPQQSLLNGTYYVGWETYRKAQDGEKRWFYLWEIECRLTEKPSVENQQEFDYLGLSEAVMLYIDINEVIFGGFNTSSI